MQTHYKDGSTGDIEKFDEKKLLKALESSAVDHVRVFNMTPEKEYEHKRKLTARSGRKSSRRRR